MNSLKPAAGSSSYWTLFTHRFGRLSRTALVSASPPRSPECLCSPNRSTDQRQETPRCSGPMFGISITGCSHLCNWPQAREPRTLAVTRASREAGRQEAQKLERHIELIGTCAAISPLLGLLGTVVGMMAVFRDVEVSGLGDPSQFANGIWQALITTAVGLAVAIPSFVFYKLLLSKVDSLILELEEMSSRLIDLLVETRS